MPRGKQPPMNSLTSLEAQMENSIPDYVLWPLVVFAALVALALIIVVTIAVMNSRREKAKAARQAGARSKPDYSGVRISVERAARMQ